MPKPSTSRKDRFRAALRQARMTAREFAALHDVTDSHLSHTLSGRPSQVLTDKIDAFIRKHLRIAA